MSDFNYATTVRRLAGAGVGMRATIIRPIISVSASNSLKVL
jgi:hypothetical protein